MTKTAMRKKLDKLWGQVVHARGDGCIIASGCAGKLEAHHLIPKTHFATRFAPCNGVLLCSKHHIFSSELSAHGASLAFAEWLQDNRIDLWEYHCEHKHDLVKVSMPWYEEQAVSLAAWLEGGEP